MSWILYLCLVLGGEADLGNTSPEEPTGLEAAAPRGTNESATDAESESTLRRIKRALFVVLSFDLLGAFVLVIGAMWFIVRFGRIVRRRRRQRTEPMSNIWHLGPERNESGRDRAKRKSKREKPPWETDEDPDYGPPDEDDEHEP